MTRIRSGEAGFTLAEMLVALLILSVGAVAMVGAMSSLVRSSVTQKNFSATDNYAKTYLEGVKQKASTLTWGCSTLSNLNPGVPAPDTGYSSPTISLTWIDGTNGAAVSDCVAYAAAKCPAESAPHPPECVPGAIKIELTLTKLSTTNRPQVTTRTETVIRRSNA